MERVGDWVCLECSNLNFGFRDICNRCDMNRVDVGKTIMSQNELESIQMKPANSTDQINLVCDFALANTNGFEGNYSPQPQNSSHTYLNPKQ